MVDQKLARAPTTVNGASNAILYARQSVKKPTGVVSFSIEGQLDAMRSFAIDKGLNVVQEFRENRSGASLNRPILSQVRSAIKDPTIGYLIVDRLDRLTRGGNADLAVLLKEFELAGVTLLTVRMDFNSSTAEGRFNILTMATLSNYQLGLIAENQQISRLNQLKQHKAIGTAAPFGYYYDPVTGHYLVDEDQAEVVRMIFKLHTSKSYGRNKIQDLVNSTLGTNYPLHLISGVLMKADKYAGHYKNAKYGSFEHIYPAIISDELAQKSTNLRLKKTYSRTNEFWLLRRKIICPYCGGKLATHKVNGHRYYYCIRNGKHKKIGTMNVPADTIEELVASTIKFVLDKAAIRESITNRIIESELTNKEREQRVKQAKTQKTNALFKKFDDGVITVEEFKKQLRVLKQPTEKAANGLETLVNRFNGDERYRYDVVSRMIDRIEVVNEQGAKKLTGIFLKKVQLNQLRKNISL